MKITRSQLRKLLAEALNETSDARKRAIERLKQRKLRRAKEQGIIDAGEMSSGPIETGYNVTLSNGQKRILPATEIGFQQSGFTSMKDLMPFVGATYDPGQDRSGVVFSNNREALQYYSKMTKMKRTQQRAAGLEAIKKQQEKDKPWWKIFENKRISSRELRKLIKEELKRLSYVSKEQGHTYGIEHLPDQYDQKKADDIIGHT